MNRENLILLLVRLIGLAACMTVVLTAPELASMSLQVKILFLLAGLKLYGLA